MKRLLSTKVVFVLFTLVVLAVLSQSAHAAASIVIQNNDGTNTGFNDPTPVTPVGGNSGTTLGQQRLNAFQFAANIWGATLNSNVTITIRASWAALSCSRQSATIGQAGAVGIFRDFPNAPVAGTWYAAALANALSGTDLNPNQPEISAQFNSNLGNAGCLDGIHFYLGVDNNHGRDVDLVATLMHEFAHGLGFQTFTNTGTGALNGGFPSVFDRLVLDNSTGKTWVQMTNAERQASTINVGHLVWAGDQTRSDVSSTLGKGTDGQGHALLYAPNPIESGSSVSHWDTSLFPNQLMEPDDTGDLTHSVTPPQDLTASLLRDIGWSTVVTTPPPSPTPTPPPTNPIDTSDFFVRQQYQDFLNRPADTSGLNFWVNELNSCGTDQACLVAKRVNVSAAFYLSIEFQETGYLVERMYKSAYGDASGTSTFNGTHSLAVPVVRFSEFLPDTQAIGQGVQVGVGNWQAQLEANKVSFAAAFVQRTRFSNAYANTLSPAAFVDALFAKAGVTPSAAERSAAIAEFGAAANNTSDLAARGRALRDVAENSALSASESNRAFVLMQFFGYLRRNPDDAPDTNYTGYDFWLTKLNQFDGSFVNADMVKAFITSAEYRRRFGPA